MGFLNRFIACLESVVAVAILLQWKVTGNWCVEHPVGKM